MGEMNQNPTRKDFDPNTRQSDASVKTRMKTGKTRGQIPEEPTKNSKLPPPGKERGGNDQSPAQIS